MVQEILEEGGGFFAGSQVGTSPGGNQFVIPGGPNFGQLQAPNVSFPSALSTAQGVGAQNVGAFFGNIEGAQEAALGLVDTDVQGIQSAVEGLSPLVGQTGAEDVTRNIERAGQIDQFNIQRAPEFNEAIAAEQQKAVEGSGLNFRGRISSILDQLGAQSEGRLSTEQLDSLLTSRLRNQGADIGAASGISARSGAGQNIQDDLDIDTRLNFILDAQKNSSWCSCTGTSSSTTTNSNTSTYTSATYSF